jgi:hypothetical protein
LFRFVEKHVCEFPYCRDDDHALAHALQWNADYPWSATNTITVFISSPDPADYHLVINDAIHDRRKICTSRRYAPTFICHHLFYDQRFCQYVGYSKGYHDLVTGHLFTEYTEYDRDQYEP